MTAQAPLLDIASLSSATARPADKINTLNALLAKAFGGEDCSRFFPDVLRACAVSSGGSAEHDQVKCLCYSFIERVFPSTGDAADSALLLVNLIRKDLSDRSACVRVAALRTLVVPGVSSVTEDRMLVEALERQAVEASSLTRRAAAIVAIKALESSLIETSDVMKILVRVFESADSSVQESGVLALSILYSQGRLSNEQLSEFLHPFFRVLVGIFCNLDDSVKLELARILTVYARLNFAANDASSEDLAALIEVFSVEADLCCSPSGVLVCIEGLAALNQPLPISAVERVLVTARDEETLILCLRSISSFPSKELEILIPRLIVNTIDSAELVKAKLDLMQKLISETTVVPILKELEVYLRPATVPKALRTVVVNIAVEIALRFPTRLPVILKGLLAIIDDDIVAGVRVLFTKARDQFSQSAIVHFARIFPHLTSSTARANLLWMLTEFHDDFPVIFPDFLRVAQLGNIFSDSFDVQIHLLILTGKVWSFHSASDHAISQKILPQLEIIVDYIFRYAVAHAEFELVREIAASLQTLMGDSLGGDVKLLDSMFKRIEVKQTDTSTPTTLPSATGVNEYACSSLSFYLQKKFAGYVNLPEFAATTQNEKLRNVDFKTMKRSTPVFNSEESFAHRMSTAVAMPARLKQPLTPKQAVASSLADLDLFFDRTEPDLVKTPVEAFSPPVKSPSVAAKPVVDLSGADLGSLFKKN